MSERDVVVEIIVARTAATATATGATAAGTGASGTVFHRRGATEVVAATAITTVITLTPTTAAAAAGIENGEFTAVTLQHDLRRIAIGAALVLPFARLELALDINLRALLQILLGNAPERLVEDHHGMPFGALAPLTALLVAPGLGGRDAQIDDGIAIAGAPHLRIAAQIADDYDLVHTARHPSLLRSVDACYLRS